MFVVAVSGYKKSGKTTLCMKLLESLAARGVRTGYIKRTHEDVCALPDTDTGKANAHGAGALLWGSDGVRYESRERGSVYALASMFFPEADAVIVEGGKDLELPKVWVKNEDDVPSVPGIFSVYNGTEDEYASLVGVIAEKAAAANATRLFADGREIAMKDFVADFVRGGVLGMLGELKGFGRPRRVHLYTEVPEKCDGHDGD